MTKRADKTTGRTTAGVRDEASHTTAMVRAKISPGHNGRQPSPPLACAVAE